ncbi:hypothetical protein HU200_017772 [Digitaria exilis]|uniref:Uncharacterized protein n=1 Tax=Digitaria exilis TaxID=1010633 RepID=A0A835F5W6_9POAL|nr:hypothetical protein HU200_017772 [Digitaria exilis]CAB3450741.1 unnamed protein product [Digitaria exilis]CAB3479585.1 unnamed protein product [Digitaria exilis]
MSRLRHRCTLRHCQGKRFFLLTGSPALNPRSRACKSFSACAREIHLMARSWAPFCLLLFPWFIHLPSPPPPSKQSHQKSPFSALDGGANGAAIARCSKAHVSPTAESTTPLLFIRGPEHACSSKDGCRTSGSISIAGTSTIGHSRFNPPYYDMAASCLCAQQFFPNGP